ncbi:MAG: terpene cyclase/mutase family protein [Chthoniobacteraceae bacterium]|nr:terpene cyclase/mutase family protein [Chthoniobacteraceae bacterium]
MKLVSLFLAMAVSQTLIAADLPTPRDNTSLRNEVQLAIDRGLSWLQKNQNADGGWSLPDYPAQTALPLTAFMLEPSGKWRKEKPEFIQRGYASMLKAVQPDGGIYVKGLANYNTSICLVALVAAGEPRYDVTIQTARDFVVGQQAKNMTDSSLDGGVGYGPVGTHGGNPDLSNTVMALEALRVSKPEAKGEIPAHYKDLNWQAVTEFVQRCQQLPETNKAAWVSADPNDRGGFIYAPGVSKAETTAPDGKKTLRSYGSMSYAGLLSYLYADVKKDDPRVVGVVDWLRKHYTLEENPGMGPEGLYYYYGMMAKALSVYGIGELETADGRKVDWRKEMALKLVNLQKPDGSWNNDNGRWMEKDPTLVTSYSVLALERIYRSLMVEK